MSNAKRRTLIALQAVMIAIFVVAIVIGMGGAGNAKADDAKAAGGFTYADARAQIENLQINGNAPHLTSDKIAVKYSGKNITALSNVSQIQSFLQGNTTATVGYLTGDIIDYSWPSSYSDGYTYFTNKIMASGRIFDGNGYSVTMNPTRINSKNDQNQYIAMSDLNDDGNTIFKQGGTNYIDLNGCFIGAIPNGSSVVNTNFIYNSQVWTYSDRSGSTSAGIPAQKGNQSGCGGFIAAYCNGVVDNCSMTMKGGKYYKMLKEQTGTTSAAGKNSYAFGGMVGTLSTGGRLSNCSINMESNSLLTVEINANKKENGRVFLGGLVGWMGNNAKAYNLYCKGNGDLQGTSSNGTATVSIISQVGIAVGSCAVGTTLKYDDNAAVTGTPVAGSVNGIISEWTGTIYNRTSDIRYSPTTSNSNSADQMLTRAVVGFSGVEGNGTDTVRNIYCIGDRYSGSNISIGYSFAVQQQNGNGQGAGRSAHTRNSVVTKKSKDSSTSYSENYSDVYLQFSTTEENSDIWVIFDKTKGESDNKNHIFWAKTVKKGVGTSSVVEEKETYYCKSKDSNATYTQCDNAADAFAFDFSYTALERGAYTDVEIDYEMGQAANLSLSQSVSIASEIQYGTYLTLPNIILVNAKTSGNLATINSSTEHGFWRTVKTGTSVLVASRDKHKDVGTYTSFVYTPQPEGGNLNYDDIHFVDTNRRIVSYIKDAQDYKDYMKAHPDYKYIDENNGRKKYDHWQNRYVQTVVPKQVNIEYKTPQGINPNLATYEPQYSGTSIVVTANVVTGQLVTGDPAVTAELEYYEADENYNPIKKVTSAVNVGKYLIKAASLSSPNYVISDSATNKTKQLQIGRRSTTVQLNPDFTFQDVSKGIKKLQLPYNGKEQRLTYDSGESYASGSYKWDTMQAFYFYNVLADDAPMIQIEFVGMDGSSDFNAIDVPDEGEVGSYKIIISFADGQAAENYYLPATTVFIVEITPIQVGSWVVKNVGATSSSPHDTYVYGEDTPENDDNGGYYAWAVAADGTTQIEPTSVKYWIMEGGQFVPYSGGSPKNVGIYKLQYFIDATVDSNYTASQSAEYVVEIIKRGVSFRQNSTAVAYATYGAEYSDGKCDEVEFSGAFSLYDSSSKTGLSTDHAANYRVGFRYQYIGAPGYSGAVTYMTDMNLIADLPSTITDIGYYLVYPIFTLPVGKDGEGNVVYDYVPEEANNYSFTLLAYQFTIDPLEVHIILDEKFTSEYSKDMPAYNGAANVEEKRIWQYAADSEVFLEADDVKVVLKFAADNTTGVGKYGVSVDYWTGVKGVAGNDGGNKSQNYTIIVDNAGASQVEIIRLQVYVKTFVDVAKVTYGDSLPTVTFATSGEDKFSDTMTPIYKYYSLGGEAVTGTPKDAGVYYVSVEFTEDAASNINTAVGNYDIAVSGVAIFTIQPKTVSITSVDVAQSEFVYNGKVQYPNITNIALVGEVAGDSVTVAFNFYDGDGNIVNDPVNVGVYTAKLESGVAVINTADGSINANYVLDPESATATATVEITKAAVDVAVGNANMFYLVPDTLSAAGAQYTVVSGSLYDTLECRLALTGNAAYAVGAHTGVVDIEFVGDKASNYTFNVTAYGDLTVISTDLCSLSEYVQVKFDGEEYVQGGVTYTGENLYDRFSAYISDVISGKVTVAVATDVSGGNITTSVVDAKTYYMVITPNDSDLTGMLTVEFTVAPATRTISASDVNVATHYNKLVFTSAIAGLQYSVNGGAFISADADNKYEYVNVAPLSNYYIQVRVARGVDPNYGDSNVVDVYARTGINAGDLAAQLNAIDEITFSNVSSYRALLARIKDVHEDDKALIDTDKIAALDKTYADLLAQASAVIAGAQSVTARSVGKSSSSATATSLALTGAGLSVSAVGLMIGFIRAKKKKEDETVVERESVKTAKVRTAKNAGKVFAAVVAVALIAVMLFAGCKKETMTQQQVLDLASYKTPSNENMRAYEITVSYGSTILYKNVNGDVTVDEHITAPDFVLGLGGSGFDFNVDYFDNISYVTSRTTATFSADVRDVSAFLGRPDATNARVTAVADILNERLSHIDVSYEESGFKIKITSTMLY